MNHLLAQRDLEAMMTSLSPLLPFVSRKSCEAGTSVLAGLLGEALEAQEAASKRTYDLKQLQPKGLMELFTPEKANGPAVAVKGKAQEAKDKGQKEKQQQREEGGREEGGRGGGRRGVPASPKEKAQAPQKRARKVTARAANVGLEDGDEDKREEVKKPKKQNGNCNKNGDKKKQSVKRGQGLWNGEEYPRITQVIKCDEGADGLRVEVHAKKQGRGQWQKVLFSLDSNQLDSIDELPDKTKQLVKVSFHKALTGRYGQHWPNALIVALTGTAWAMDVLPAGAEEVGKGQDGDLEGLGNPIANANLFDIE